MKRSALLAYLLLWITFGLYLPLWAYRMMSEINASGYEHPFKIRRVFYVVGTYALAYCAVYWILWITPSHVGGELSVRFLAIYLVGFALAVGWFALFAQFMAKLARAIADIQLRRGIAPSASAGLAAFLFFVFFTSVPYLQAQWNKSIAE